MKKYISTLCLFCAFAGSLSAQTITTYIGTSSFGYSGDGGPATAARICLPAGVAMDAAGNLYSTDYGMYRVRVTDAAGIIHTFAGRPPGDVGGDGGPATAGGFRDPLKVAVDKHGNVYVVDDYGHSARKIDAATGIITLFAGTYTAGDGADGIPATAAALNYPSGVACDTSGNVYIADANSCIRKVAPDGTITTFAGSHIYGNAGDGGPATAARIGRAEGIFVAPDGNIYFADLSNSQIKMINTSGIITTVAGTGVAGYSGDGGAASSAKLNQPLGVTVDKYGNIFIADYGNHRIRKINTTGIISTVAGTGELGYSGDGGPATDAKLNNPRDVCTDADGNVYIGDLGNHRVRKISFSGTGVGVSVAGNGSIKVFPNPSNGVVRVVAANLSAAQPVYITLSNSLGQIIEKRIIASGNTLNETFTLSALPHGKYIIHVANAVVQYSSVVSW